MLTSYPYGEGRKSSSPCCSAEEGVVVELVGLDAVLPFDWLSLETVLLSHCSAEEGVVVVLVGLDAVQSF